MATYKVIQDIEAEDKLLGPLSLRQFIYAGICALCLYLSFLVITKHVAFLIVVFAPVAIFTGFFAFPWKLNQPTEIWALAKIRFLFKPRRRIWDQSGAKELVTITAPKKVEVNYTNGLSQTEVTSRLKALADTIDSRGWAVKNVNVNFMSVPVVAPLENSDRLVNAASLPQEVSNVDVQAADDMLDEHSNPIAQQFDQMIHDSSRVHREQIVQSLQKEQDEPAEAAQPWLSLDNNAAEPTPAEPATPEKDRWFTRQPTTQQPAPAIDYSTPGPAGLPDDAADSNPTEEAKLSKRLKAQHRQSDIANSHLRTLNPTTGKPVNRLKRRRPGFHGKAAPMTQTPDPAILKLAGNNDLNVATLARQVNQKKPAALEDEVVISLH